jgi:acetoin utilization deacetylase AcuC-like enzyme
MKNTHDVALPDGTGDEEYLALLQGWLPRLMGEYRPQIIFFQAGVDALKGDK